MTDPRRPASSPDHRPDLRWSGLTHRGHVRTNNEDNFLALAFDGREIRYLGKIGEASTASNDFVFAVSDGMGGAKAGEFASRITLDRITRLLPKSFKLGAQGLASGFADILEELFGEIHRDLLRLAQSYEECAGMGTTLSLAWLTPGWLYFGHIGDSRIYYFPKTGGLTQLTHDHSHVGWLRRQGQINEREARTHPMRHSLHQALGSGHQLIEPQFGAVAFTPGDRFLLCSDGLIDGLWDRHLEEIMREPSALPIAQRLLAPALENSGKDNTTAVTVEILGELTPAPQDPPLSP